MSDSPLVLTISMSEKESRATSVVVLMKASGEIEESVTSGECGAGRRDRLGGGKGRRRKEVIG